MGSSGAVQVRDAIASRRLSAAEGVRASLAAIEKSDTRLRCFLETFAGRALEQAALVDARIARGESPGPLAGVPVALKDNIHLFQRCVRQ